MSVKVAKIISEQIIEAIENGEADGKFQLPWHNKGRKFTFSIPVNAVTKKSYQGTNVLLLWMAAQSHGFSKNIWATYKQWKSVGATVKPKERGSIIVFFKPMEIIDKVTEEEKTVPFLRYSKVHNIDQVEGFELPETNEEDIPIFGDNDYAEQFIENCSIDIDYGHDKACYIPSKDRILMPAFDQFNNSVDYYATLFHESAHWTGHESRLNRTFGKRFGDDAYAMEELVAELSAAFTCASLKVTGTELRTDHAKYIKHWLRVLKDDPRAILNVSKEAQKATDFLFKLQDGKEQSQVA